jgi:2-oxoglutarate decarboxylase
VSEITSGSFQEVLPDTGIPAAEADAVRRVVFASGKVGVEAVAARDKLGGAPVAVARVEQLYPWPYEGVASVLAQYPNATELVWLQEEPENMGAWNHIKGRLYEAHEETHSIRRVSRQESASPASGVLAIHQAEQRDLLDNALAST